MYVPVSKARLICSPVKVATFECKRPVFHGKANGQAMGSPFTLMPACLFMEALDTDSFLNIVGIQAIWLRYVYDVLGTVNKGLNLKEELKIAEQVHDKIRLTTEVQSKGKL